MHNVHLIVELCVFMIIGFVAFTPLVKFVLYILFKSEIGIIHLG